MIVSGSAGCHGAAVMMARAGLGGGALRSDCMALHRLSAAVLACGGVRVLRDPTRGGIATTLNEFVEGSALGVELEEDAHPRGRGGRDGLRPAWPGPALPARARGAFWP